MPRRVIGPDGKENIFPDEATDEQITKALTAHNPANPDTAKFAPKSRTWTDVAVDLLPTAGGIAGGIVGGIGGTVAGVGVGGVPGAIGGAALGGGAGEAAKQLVNRVRGVEAPSSPMEAAKDIGESALMQGGAEVAGGLVGGAMTRMAPHLMQSALKPGMKASLQAVKSGEVPPVVNTMLKEGINVSPRGMDKLNVLLNATDEEIKDAIASVTANVSPLKVTSRLSDTARTFGQQVNPVSDLNAVSKAGHEFLAAHPQLTVQEAQALKTGTYRQLRGKFGELKSADVESQKALARGLKEEIADEVRNSLAGFKGQLGMKGGIDIDPLNAREGALIAAREELARRLVVSGRRDPMGLSSLAISHPATFLTALIDRSPAIKSMIARGMYVNAGNAVKVSPQLIKMAVQALATADEPSETPTESAGQQ